jgi:hypothetical protein
LSQKGRKTASAVGEFEIPESGAKHFRSSPKNKKQNSFTMGLFGKKKETPPPTVETAAQKKEREAAEEAAAFKKRAGKVNEN